MRRLICSAAVMVCISTWNSAFAQAPTETERVLLQELREIRQLLMDTRAEVDALRKEAKNTETKTAVKAGKARPSLEDFDTHMADPDKLEQIKLPADPSDDQIKDYIREIQSASRGQNCFSSDDPQVAMLARIGADHLNILLNSLNDVRDIHGFEDSYHVQYAILKLAKDGHKQLILDALADHPFLAEVVTDKGWEQDARDILIQGLSSSTSMLPGEWIQAVANLRDPKTYDGLKWYFIHEDNRFYTFQRIKDLPGIKLEDAVATIWGKTGYHDYEEKGVAKIAIQFGYIEALEFLVDCLQDEENDKWDIAEIRKLVLRHVDFHGSNKEIADWLKKNAEHLVFDKQTKKFTVSSDAKAAIRKEDMGGHSSKQAPEAVDEKAVYQQ